MRVLLLNDTSASDNIGGRATSHGLIDLLRANGADTIDSLSSKFRPVGSDEFFAALPPALSKGADPSGSFWLQQFQKMPVGLRYFFQRVERTSGAIRLSLWIGNRFPEFSSVFETTRDFRLNFQFDLWAQWAQTISQQDAVYLDKLKLADAVILNGEGTIHHDHRHALSALAMLRAAQMRGKATYLVNSTFQALHPQLLEQVIKKSTRVVVRDKASFRYLRKAKVPCDLGADCAFLAPFEKDLSASNLPRLSPQQKNCIITGGARSLLNRYRVILKIVSFVRKQGYTPYYLYLTSADTRIAERLEQAGVPVIQFSAEAWRWAVPFLKQAQLVISGRHHINLFSILAGVPFIPLSSNTWKIQGTCALLGWPVPVVRKIIEFRKVMGDLPRYLKTGKNSFEQMTKIGRELAQRNGNFFKRERVCAENNA